MPWDILFHHRFSTSWIPFFIVFCTHYRYIIFTLSLNRFIKTFYQAQLHQVSCHHLHQVGCHSRTTLYIILLTNIISHHIYIIYQFHHVKNNFIRWIAIKDNTCQQSHVLIFIQWAAIKDNTLHHIANNLPLWTWWQPQWCLVTTIDRSIKNTMTPCHFLHFWHHSFSSFKHHVILPLWHQGQRADQKPTCSPPFLLM